MKPVYKLLILLFIAQKVTAQNEINSIQIGAGKSWHGTGDMNGIAVDLMYEHSYSKRLSFANGLTTTIHYRKDEAFNTLFPGISPDERLMRFTTAGLQLNSLAGFAFFAKPDHKLKVNAGVIFRFQSTSYPQQYSYHQDSTVFPEPFYVIYEPGKQNTISPGYAVGFSYLTSVSRKYQIGIKVFFQNDTNADAITGVSLIFGRVLPGFK